MTREYQPVIVRELLRHGGTCSSQELATALLLNDQFQMRRSMKVLMRWPKRTLVSKGVVTYNRKTRNFTLIDLPTGVDLAAAIELCQVKIDTFNRTEGRVRANLRMELINEADGRCQACGVSGLDRPLDIDHIVPKSKATSGKVPSKSPGKSIPVDDRDNLQVLCQRCNRGKRADSSRDFRPSTRRIAETIWLAEQRAKEEGRFQEVRAELKKLRDEAQYASAHGK